MKTLIPMILAASLALAGTSRAQVSCDYTIYCLFDTGGEYYGAVGGNASRQLRIYLYERGQERSHTGADYYYSKSCQPGPDYATVFFPEGVRLTYSPMPDRSFVGNINEIGDIECLPLGPSGAAHH